MNWEDVFCRVCESLFRISAGHSRGTVHATGYVVAKYEKPDKLAFVLATAEHVFRPLRPYENIHWRIQRFDWKGQPQDWATFKSNLDVLGNSPIRANLVSDVGVLFAPKVERDVIPLRLADPAYAVRPGTKVGWAGFPGFVTQRTGDVRPCYFEGVVSAVVDRVASEERLFYLVDGHGGQGVSGGPLWCWNDEQNEYEVIGICSQYVRADDHPGGMVVFEALNPVVAYLRGSAELEMDIASL